MSKDVKHKDVTHRKMTKFSAHLLVTGL